MSGRSTFLSLSLLLFACSQHPAAYDDDWGADLPGKADSIVDLAQPIEIGELVTGSVDEQSVVLYHVELQRGDQLRVTKRVTSGDLAPHFTLFFSLSDHLRSQSFDVDDDGLVKTYEIEGSGRHLLAVRAFQHQGQGDYELEIECTGGPCNGEILVEPLENEAADDCIARAQQCAFDEMDRYNGAVGSVRARTLFEDCLAELQSVDGSSCVLACEDHPDADGFDQGERAEVCDDVIAELPFFADASGACLAALDDCMEQCVDLVEFNPFDSVFDQGFARCWTFGFNGTCPAYAREHESCGGALAANSDEECFAYCESTDGAWVDDLDTICDDFCG